MSLIRMREVRKHYDMGEVRVEALRGVDLDVTAGEFLAIVGPSGSGKSTLMNILGCLDVADSGEYTISGVDVRQMDDDELSLFRGRHIGFVFQSFNLLPRTSAVENVAMPLIYSKARDPYRRASDALERVGLADRASHWPSRLSGGQQQRVALARALVTEPDIILADEPTGALDTATGEEVMSLMTELSANGDTIVVITHEPHIAAFAGRTISLRDGLIERDEVRA